MIEKLPILLKQRKKSALQGKSELEYRSIWYTIKITLKKYSYQQKVWIGVPQNSLGQESNP